MSQTLVNSTNNQAHVRTDNSKIFVWGKRTETGDFDWENTGYDVDLAPGTVVARVGATGKIVPLDPAASDGSEFAIGVLMSDLGEVLAGDTLTTNCTFCVEGDVAAEKLIFIGATTLDTPVDNRQVRDWLRLVGIKLVTTTEHTAYDNA